MQIGPKTMAQAAATRNRVQQIASALKAIDNTAADRDNRPGAVSIDFAGNDGVDVRMTNNAVFKDVLRHGSLTFDTASGKATHLDVSGAEVCDASWSNGAQSPKRYTISQDVDRQGKPLLIYTQERTIFSDWHQRETIKVDAASGNIVSYKGKEWGVSFGQGLKDVFTHPAGLFLVGMVGGLCAIPFSLPAAMFGSAAAGLGGAALTAVAIAAFKTRPASTGLPKHNE